VLAHDGYGPGRHARGRTGPRRVDDDPVDAGAVAPPSAGLALDLAALGCETAMLVLLGLGGWDLGSGGLFGISLAVFYPALAVLIWGMWVAPRARRRLRDPWLLLLQVALFVATGVQIGVAGHRTTAWVFPPVAVAVFVAARVVSRRAAAAPIVDPSDDLTWYEHDDDEPPAE
jgi:hypothetical protein